MTFQGKKHNQKSKRKISKALTGNKHAEGHSHVPPNKKYSNNREQQRAFYQKRRKFVDKLKDTPCKDCSNKFPPECMDFDHVRGKKEFAISTNRMMPKSKLLKETKKCDIICANCHRIRTKKSDLLRKRKVG